MDRAIKRTFTILAIFILLCGITLNIGQISAFAAGEDIPKEGVTYTLTYPDGTVVTEKDGKPLTFDDVTEALKEENWRLLGSGYTSDKEGKAVLPSSWTEGTIKIIETKVPAGYTQGTDPNQIVNLKDGTVEFVNPKIKEEETTYSITYKLNGGELNGKTEDIVEEYPEGTEIDILEAPVREGYEFDYWEGSKHYPGDKYTVVEDHTFVAQWKENSDDNDIIDDEDNNNNDNDSDDTQKTDTTSDKSKKTVIKETKSAAATGDTADLSLYFGFFISSLLVIAFALSYRFVFAASSNASINSRKAKSLIIAVIISMAAGIAMASIAYSAGGFTINKVDDNGDPVEGAVFDVYGKPAVSFEEKEQEKVNISGTKTWEDADDQDGKRPDSITVRLHADGKEVDSKVVTAEGDWKYFFTDKPKYEGNKEIAYSITEDAVADYKTELSGFDITNSYTPGKTSLTVTKVWEDADDQDGIRPDSVKVNLLADGEKKDEATLNEDSGWTYTFSDLDEKKAGEAISYTVEEADVPESYTSVVTGGAEEGFTITNAHTPETTSISVTKEWDDASDQDGKRPEKLELILYRGDDEVVAVKEINAKDGDSQTCTFTEDSDGNKLPIADENGEPYTYFVREDPSVRRDFTPEYLDASGNPLVDAKGAPDGGTIVNTHEPEMVDITGTKLWRDGGKTHDNAKEVTLTLYRSASGSVADAEKVAGATPTWDGNKYTFADQLKYDSQRYEFIYEVREETVPEGYEVSYADASGAALDDSATGVPNGGTITNKHTPTTVTVSGKKTWTSSTGNNDDLDTSKIPEKYTVRLEKSIDGTNWTTVSSQEVASYMAPLPAPTDPIMPTDEWTFSNLPAKEGEVDIQYRVVEETVPDGFTMSGGTKDANGKYNLTNTYTPATSSVNIKVGLEYLVYSGGKWSDVVKTTPQKVTVSGDSMTESKTLSFSPGSEAQEVKLPGEGTYTIKMQDIAKNDLQSEDALSALQDSGGENPMPIIIDTVSATVKVDGNGNCTVTGTTGTSFAFGKDSNSGEFVYNDIPAIKVAYEGTGADEKLNTLNPHSKDASASASGSTVTLTTVVSQGWDDSTEPAVQ